MNRNGLDVADAERRKEEMREKISVAAVATIIVVVSSVIVRQVHAMTADTARSK